MKPELLLRWKCSSLLALHTRHLDASILQLHYRTHLQTREATPAQGTEPQDHVKRPDYSQPVPTTSSEPQDSVAPQFLEYVSTDAPLESRSPGPENLEVLYQTLYSMIPGFTLKTMIHEVLLHHTAAYLETLHAENAAARAFFNDLENARKVDASEIQNDAPKRRRKRGIATANRKCIKPKRLSKRQIALSTIADSDDSDAAEMDPPVSPLYGPPNHDPADSDTTKIETLVYNVTLMEADTSDSDEGDSIESWRYSARKVMEMGVASQARYGVKILMMDKHSTLKPRTLITSTGKIYDPTLNRHEYGREAGERNSDTIVETVEELAAEWAAMIRDHDMERNAWSASPMKRKASSDSSNLSPDDEEGEDGYSSERSRSPNKIGRMRRSVTPEVVDERKRVESDRPDSL